MEIVDIGIGLVMFWAVAEIIIFIFGDE